MVYNGKVENIPWDVLWTPTVFGWLLWNMCVIQDDRWYAQLGVVKIPSLEYDIMDCNSPQNFGWHWWHRYCLLILTTCVFISQFRGVRSGVMCSSLNSFWRFLVPDWYLYFQIIFDWSWFFLILFVLIAPLVFSPSSFQTKIGKKNVWSSFNIQYKYKYSYSYINHHVSILTNHNISVQLQ